MRDVARSRAFYADVLGGQVVLEENPCIVKLANGWIIMNPGGGPTPDKPGISVVPYQASNEVSTFLNLRVADIDACYHDWKAKGADFLTEPIDRGAEVRCYMRDPDGYLIEVGQATAGLTPRPSSLVAVTWVAAHVVWREPRQSMHGEDRHDRERIARLRTLAAELELLPRTRARDELLREVHHRAVMLDTGVPAISCWGGVPENGQAAFFQDMALPAITRNR